MVVVWGYGDGGLGNGYNSLSLCLPVCLRLCLSVCLSLPVCLPLSVYLAICLPVGLPVSFFAYLSASVCLSLPLSPRRGKKKNVVTNNQRDVRAPNVLFQYHKESKPLLYILREVVSFAF